jgi:hypothetical protein
MKTLKQILERVDNINKQVSQKGRNLSDRDMPDFHSQRLMKSRPSLRVRRENIRKVSKQSRNKIYDNSPDTPKANRTKAISNKIMRSLGEDVANLAKRIRYSSAFSGSDDNLKKVYDLRREGHSEGKIAKVIGSMSNVHMKPSTLFFNADQEEHIGRPDYHPPNSHHPTLPDHVLAHIYKERASGKTDGVIGRDMNDDITFHREPKSAELRYNADHVHVIRRTMKSEFKRAHGIGYVPPNDGLIGGGPRSKHRITDKHFDIMKKASEENPSASAYALAKKAGIHTNATGTVRKKLKALGISYRIGKKPDRVDKSSPFHTTLHDMIHKEGMQNNEIIAASKARLGRKLSKGALLGYMHRNGLGSNPNKGQKGPRRA